MASGERTLSADEPTRREFDRGSPTHGELVAHDVHGRVMRTNGRKRLASVIAGAAALVLLATALPAATATAGFVSIEGFVFNPDEVTVATGDTVQWTNNDFVAHNVSGGSFQSGNFVTGTFSHTFVAPGTFSYICTLHSGMRGTIFVTDAPDPVVPDAPWPVMLSATAVLLAALFVVRPRLRAA